MKTLTLVSACLALTLVGLLGFEWQKSPQRTDSLLFTATRYPVGTGPGSVELADVNSDGFLDILVANQDSGNLTVLLGDGRGGFRLAPGSPFPAGYSPNDMALGDFNGDGKLDVAFANHDRKHLTLLLGDGRGAFTPAPGSPFAVRSNPHTHGVAAGDFNGDGRLDLATESWGEDSVVTLLADGKGGFLSPGTAYRVGKAPYERLRVADVNRDGRPDIITTNWKGDSISVLLNNGQGSFDDAPATPFACPRSPFGVAIGDMNGDGNPDLAVVHYSGQIVDPSADGVSVLVGDGRGGFRVVPGSPFRTGKAPTQLALGDMNGDGRPDVIVTNMGGDSITILLNSGSGRLLPGATIRVGRHPIGVAIGDLNGDGRPDVVVANNHDNDITILLRR